MVLAGAGHKKTRQLLAAPAAPAPSAPTKPSAPLALLTLCALALFLLTSCGGQGGGSHVEGPPRDTTPVVLEVSQPGVAVVADEASSAVLDYSNAAEGYICVMSNLPGTRVKVLVEVDNAQYQYTIDEAGVYITIPLSRGNALYSVGVLRNVPELSEDTYSPIFTQDINVELNDEFKPFLYPSQFVNFSSGDEAVSLSQELATGSVTDVDAINNIYNWVCANIDYDREEATTVASGYLPDNTDTLNLGKGICFDYAVLTVSMLRAQRVPAQLVIGYAGSAYHAWIAVYSVETGTVLNYTFNGSSWETMDPTFDAAAGGANDLMQVIGDGTNYNPVYYY